MSFQLVKPEKGQMGSRYGHWGRGQVGRVEEFGQIGILEMVIVRIIKRTKDWGRKGVQSGTGLIPES